MMKVEDYLKNIQKSESLFPMDNLHKGERPLMNVTKDEGKKPNKKKEKIE